MAFGFGKSRGRTEPDEIIGEDVGWLDAGVEVEGKMRFRSGMMRLNTHFKGEIACEGTVLVNDQGDIEAEIHAKMVSISGKVKGTIHASERLEIKEHGIVLGTMYTPCLLIEPGGYFDGQCHMPTPEPERQTAQELDSKDNPG